MSSNIPILEVRNLTVSVPLAHGGRGLVVDNVSLQVGEGESVGLVGESGSGKTMTCLAIMRLLPAGARVESGEVLFEGEDFLKKSAREMQRIRGSQAAMVLQDAMTALDPCYTIRTQIAVPLRQHRRLRGEALEAAMVKAFEQVRLSVTKERLRQYPHQLSGGMRQRVASAIALAGQPRFLIADEPTSALDATTQVRYLALLEELQEESGFGLIFVTHDLLIVRDLCERMIVFYASQPMEEGPVGDVFGSPEHPYTRALLGGIPKLGDRSVLQAIEGQPPDVSDQVVGCKFAPRCQFARDVCRNQDPPLSTRGSQRAARCWGTEPDGWIADLMVGEHDTN